MSAADNTTDINLLSKYHSPVLKLTSPKENINGTNGVSRVRVRKGKASPHGSDSGGSSHRIQMISKNAIRPAGAAGQGGSFLANYNSGSDTAL